MGIRGQAFVFYRILTLLGIGINFLPGRARGAPLLTSQPKFDLQLLLDPEDAETGLKELERKVEVAERKQVILERELWDLEPRTKDLEASMPTFPLVYNPNMDYRGLLGKFEEVRLGKEALLRVQTDLNSTGAVIAGLRRLQGLIKGPTVRLSEVRAVMSPVLHLSREVFRTPEEREAMGSFCIKVTKAQAPLHLTLDEEVKNICFNII